MPDQTPLTQPEHVDALSIFKYVRVMLGEPTMDAELDDQSLEVMLHESLDKYSRLIPKMRWFSMPAFAGVQEYKPPRDTIGYGIVDVMIPRIDPIAPLLLSSGPRLDIFGYRYCLAGDTSVSLLDGRERTILEIIEEYGDGPFWVYSVDEHGEVKPGLAHSARKTGEQEEVVRVTIDNGNSVVVTPNHKFVMRDGSEKPASELAPGDSLMPLYRGQEKISSKTKDYETCYAAGEKKFTHRIVAELTNNGSCSICGVELPDSKHGIRHHVNFNHRDNRPENLRWVTHEEHGDIHNQFRELWKNPEFRAAITQRMQNRLDNDPQWRDAASSRARKQWEDTEYRDEKIASLIERHKSDPEFRAIRDKAASETLKKLWADAEWRPAKSTAQSSLMTGKWLDEEWRATHGQVVLAALDEARNDPAWRAHQAELLSERSKDRWGNDPVYRAKMSRVGKVHLDRLWKDPEFRMKVTIRSSQRMARLWEDPEFRERHRERLIARWRDPAFRDHQSEAASQAMTAKWADLEFKRSTSEKMTIGRVRSSHNKKKHNGEFDGCTECRVEIEKRLAAKLPTNHKVVSVEPAGLADVYSISVEEYHNFALTIGCQTKNSYPYRDISELYTDYFYFSEATKILSSTFEWEWLDGAIRIHPKPDEPFPLTYEAAFPRDLNSIPRDDVDWIKNHVLAQAEISLGRIRRKFRIPGAQSEQMLDGQELVEEGFRRLESAEAELKLRTPPLPIYR